MHIIPTLEKQRQEDHSKFRVSQGYIVKPHLKKKNNNSNNNKTLNL